MSLTNPLESRGYGVGASATGPCADRLLWHSGHRAITSAKGKTALKSCRPYQTHGGSDRGFSTYQVVFNSGVTAEPLFFPTANLIIQNGGMTSGMSVGSFFSSSTFTIGPTGFVINCPCTFISFMVYLNQTTFLLANGQPFHAFGTSTPAIILPPAGDSFVQPGQSAPIILREVPEPSMALLMSIGLTILTVRWKHRTA